MLRYALSVRQPWAWAILHAGKDIENRDWHTNLRGPFLIHAAKGMSRVEYADFIVFYDNVIRPEAPELPPCPPPDQLQFGGIVGEAKILDCVRRHPSPWFAGRYGFVLTEACAVPFRPLKGSLGFFNPDVMDKP
ncbi:MULTISPECIES: ASCH domain-containing protein [Rhodomicrobium]|uniref:ASCH domain-containing protein n=1 Tax=Rhodomicrobium TaxID=1068 RepID=UPI000B4AEB33|nr:MULTISPECIES: ASCH domain-containing protein [Rhodomicrobium]